MQEVAVYDARRVPPNWSELLLPSQVAVFQEDALTGIVIDADGLASSVPKCLVFDSLDEARSYCRARNAEMPRLQLAIYDSRGRGADPLAIFGELKGGTHELTSPFRRAVACACLVASLILIWFDWRVDFDRQWPSILASKLLVTSAVFLVWELALIAEKALARRRRA
jgi:hypothetical protein